MEIPSVDTEVSEFDNADDAQLIRTSSKTSPKISPSIAVRHKQLLPSTRKWRYIVAIVATSSLGSFLWGYNFAVIAGAMLLIDDHFNLSVLWHETIVTMLVVGATVEAAIAGTLNNKFGRWKVMMMSAILYGIGAVVMALAFSKILLVIGRAVAGLAIGSYITASKT